MIHVWKDGNAERTFSTSEDNELKPLHRHQLFRHLRLLGEWSAVEPRAQQSWALR